MALKQKTVVLLAIGSLLLGLGIAAALLFGFTFVYGLANPEEKVSVTVKNIPSESENSLFVAIVADENDKPVPYNVYGYGIFPKPESPFDGYSNSYWPDEDYDFNTDVEWYDSDYIGVLYGSNDFSYDASGNAVASWTIAWFPIDSPDLIWDGDKILTIDVKKAEVTEKLDDKKIKLMELDTWSYW